MTNPTLTQIAKQMCRDLILARSLKPHDGYTIEDEVENAWHLWIPEARSAVQALIANISEEMIEAGAKKDAEFEFTDSPIIARAIFTAMLQSLLKGDGA